MDIKDLGAMMSESWNVHNNISLMLLDAIPDEGLRAVSLKSRGRSVAEQFFHMYRTRVGWEHYHRTGKRPKVPKAANVDLSREYILTLLEDSGRLVEALLVESLEGKTTLRAFAKNPLRWMSYLIAHESHHRGQIMLALKQNGMKMPESIALQGLWQSWMWNRKEK